MRSESKLNVNDCSGRSPTSVTCLPMYWQEPEGVLLGEPPRSVTDNPCGIGQRTKDRAIEVELDVVANHADPAQLQPRETGKGMRHPHRMPGLPPRGERERHFGGAGARTPPAR